MNKKEITINGKQYQVAFDLQTMLNFEQNVGRSFFTIDFNNLSIENRISLIHAAVKSADENTQLTVEDIKGQRKFDDLNAILAASNTIVMLSLEFLQIPDVEKEQEQEQQEGDKQPKN